VAVPTTLRKFELHLGRDPIDEMASILFNMTYGEMMALTDMIWKAQPAGSANNITYNNLPIVLHRWAKAHTDAKIAPEVVVRSIERADTERHRRD